MIRIREKWIENVVKALCVLLILISFLSLLKIATAAPAGPVITYVSNSTAPTITANRSMDAKGTITTLLLTSNQQDYKWKAYVGNVTGSLSLDNANGVSIYDWAFASITGELYVTRASSVSWTNVACVNQTVVDSEQSVLGMSSSQPDSINSTFRYTVHRSFLVGSLNISNSTCRSTATYINDSNQTINEAAFFQEVLLKDNSTSSLIYTTILEQDHASYDGVNTFDFQLLVAENESSSVPINYYFYVELG